MFTVEIDLWQAFCPPMGARSNGIVLTRSIQIPFVPTADVAIFGSEIDPTPGPLGILLKDITWDIDRKVFLANSYASNTGPIGFIPYDLRNWIDKGWRFGSSHERYDQDRKRKSKELPPLRLPPFSDEDELEAWEALPPKKRPKEFNLLLKSLIRVMAEGFEDEEVAYAMDKMMMYFDDHQLEKNRTPASDRFRTLKYEFSQMPIEKKMAWRDRAIRKYPRIQRFVDGC